MKIQIELTEAQVKQVMEQITTVLYHAKEDAVTSITEAPEFEEPSEEEKERGNKVVSDDVIEHISARLDAGEKLQPICDEYNLNYSTVYNRIDRAKKKRLSSK